MRKILILAVIILVIILAFLLSKKSEDKNIPPPTEEMVEETKERTFNAKESERTITENEDGWLINATYPVSSNVTISSSVEDTVRKIITDFKENDFGIVLEDGFQSTLGINYSVTESQKTVSYVFSIYSYSGGAHGVTSMVTRVYDIETGEQLRLRDIFVPEFFTNLREELRAKLTEKLGDNSTKNAIEGGTALEDYIENFYLTDTAIGFVFSSYAVGPYAIGTVDVQIPFTELGSIIKIEEIR